MTVYTREFKVSRNNYKKVVAKIDYTDSAGGSGTLGVSDGTEVPLESWDFGGECATGYAATFSESRTELFAIETSPVALYVPAEEPTPEEAQPEPVDETTAESEAANEEPPEEETPETEPE